MHNPASATKEGDSQFRSCCTSYKNIAYTGFVRSVTNTLSSSQQDATLQSARPRKQWVGKEACGKYFENEFNLQIQAAFHYIPLSWLDIAKMEVEEEKKQRKSKAATRKASFSQGLLFGVCQISRCKKT